MILYLIGIDYKISPRNMREEAYGLRSDIARYWENNNPGNTAVLSTCNRIEIYSATGTCKEALFQSAAFKKCFKRQFGNAHVYCGEVKVFGHGLRLACGLESQFQGEYQILQQLEAWRNSKNFPVFLNDIWQRIIKEAIEIRKKAELGENVVDIATLIFNEIRRALSPIRRVKVLVIGTGKVAELLAAKKPEWTSFSFVARKNRKKAKKLAELTKNKVLLPDDVPENAVNADVIISATSSPHYVLAGHHFNRALAAGRKKRLYIYDVAMPPDVMPEVGKIPFVKLQNLDDLALNFTKENNIVKRIKLAAWLIEKRVKEFTYAKKDTPWNEAEHPCVEAGQGNNKAVLIS